jgi:thymidine phosphorylase
VSRPSARQTFRAIDVIRKKRDGIELAQAEIEGLVNAYTNGEIPDYQVSAWLMAVVLKGMTRPETAALTDAMLHSGDVLDLSSLPAKKVDSTRPAASATRPLLCWLRWRPRPVCLFR